MYSSHLRRQAADLRTFLADEALALDPALDYGAVEGLSAEVRERLRRVRPASIVSVLQFSLCSLGMGGLG